MFTKYIYHECSKHKCTSKLFFRTHDKQTFICKYFPLMNGKGVLIWKKNQIPVDKLHLVSNLKYQMCTKMFAKYIFVLSVERGFKQK